MIWRKSHSVTYMAAPWETRIVLCPHKGVGLSILQLAKFILLRVTENLKREPDASTHAVIAGHGSSDIFTGYNTGCCCPLSLLPENCHRGAFPSASISFNKGLRQGGRSPTLKQGESTWHPVLRMLNTNSIMRSKHWGCLRITNQGSPDSPTAHV
jgi:hypothetical protein